MSRCCGSRERSWCPPARHHTSVLALCTVTRPLCRRGLVARHSHPVTIQSAVQAHPRPPLRDPLVVKLTVRLQCERSYVHFTEHKKPAVGPTMRLRRSILNATDVLTRLSTPHAHRLLTSQSHRTLCPQKVNRLEEALFRRSSPLLCLQDNQRARCCSRPHWRTMACMLGVVTRALCRRDIHREQIRQARLCVCDG